jgi:iron complex outermembrane receptor protein
MRGDRVRGTLCGRYYDTLEEGTVDGVYGTYEAAFFVDAKVTVTPVAWMDVSLSLDNLLDEEYYEYYRTDGRSLFLAVTFRY